MNGIIVYTSPACPKCIMLKTYLKEKGIMFEERNVYLPKYRSDILSLSITTLPTLIWKEVTLTGFNPKEVDGLLARGATND